jgi:hypothetical protein
MVETGHVACRFHARGSTVRAADEEVVARRNGEEHAKARNDEPKVAGPCVGLCMVSRWRCLVADRVSVLPGKMKLDVCR